MKNIPEELIPVIDYWERHGKATVAAALVVICAGVGYWAWDRARTETRAEVSETLARSFAEEGGASPAEAVGELQDAIAKAVDAGAVPLLKLRLAKMQYAAGNYAEAKGLYTELRAAPPAGFEDVPAFGLAATTEAEGAFAEAKAAYEACLKEFPGSMMRLEAELGVARCQAQAGEKEAAVKALEARRDALEGLDAARIAKKDALEKAEAALSDVRKKDLPGEEKVKVLTAAEAAVEEARKALAALDGDLRTKDMSLARIKATLELMKRWEGRKAGSLLAAVAQASEALEQVEAGDEPKAEAKPEVKDGPAPQAPAEKKAE